MHSSLESMDLNLAVALSIVTLPPDKIETDTRLWGVLSVGAAALGMLDDETVDEAAPAELHHELDEGEDAAGESEQTPSWLSHERGDVSNFSSAAFHSCQRTRQLIANPIGNETRKSTKQQQ